MFETRPEGSYFGFGGSPNAGGKGKWTTIEEGDEAELRLGDERVRVKVTTASGDCLEGIIQGFEPSRTQEYQGYRENQQITFKKDNIFNRYCHE